ncbi:MAG: type II secretion system protein [Acidimicrobiales bacterium]
MLRTSSIHKPRGFTLLELTIVIVVLGILAAIAVPSFLSVIGSSRTGVASSGAISTANDAIALAAESHSAVSGANLLTAISEDHGLVSLLTNPSHK